MKRQSTLPILSRRQRRREKARPPAWRIWLFLLAALFALFLLTLILPVTAAAVGGLYLTERTPPVVDRLVESTVALGVDFYARNIYEGELPSPDTVATTTAREFKTTKIFSRDGVLLWEVYDPRGGNRQVVRLEDISPHLINATIALEDKTFYDNPGVDLRGITRAAFENLRSGEIVGGGSSITQQLVKLVAIEPEERFVQSYDRKIKEVILAIELSSSYDKDTILEWYLNTINYGRLAYGAQAASAEYFGKSARDLSVAEAAMLAMLPNAPALYDPYTEPESAIERQQIVLNRMFEEGYITFDEYQSALEEPVLEQLVQPENYEISAPHFTLYVQQKLEEQYGRDLLYRGGLTVVTTLDYGLYLEQEQMAREHIAEIQSQGIDASNAAVVTLNPRTGEIISMVGSLDYNNADIDGNINMAVAPRQPGSSVKPYTYLTALANGYTLASMVWDVRTVFNDFPNPNYVPENYERDYRGPVLFRDALQLSLNIPAVKVMDLVGIDNVIDTMHRMGINGLRREDVGLSLTLGGGEVSLLDHVYAFSVMANNGVMVGEPVPELKQRPGYRELQPVAILRVEDARGEVIHAYLQPETRQIISPQLAFLMQNAMSDNEARIPAFGEPNPLTLPDRPVAAKTGSTNDFRDGWTLGYTPQYVTGVWVGNADFRVMTRDEPAPGSKVAAPIWQRIMMRLHEGEPVENFTVPPGIVQVQVCARSGLLPTPSCPEVRTEIFIEGTQPTTPDTLFQAFRICGDSSRLATVFCPPEQVQSRVFMMIPPEAVDWARASNIPLPPIAYDDSYGPSVGGPVSILSPAPYSTVAGTVTITGNAFVPQAEPPPEPEPPVEPLPEPVEGEEPPPEGEPLPEIPVVPTPAGPQFRFYRIQVGAGLDPASWIHIGPDHTDTRQNDTLEFWDTRSFADGLYTIQLTMVRDDGAVEVSAVQVTVDNTRPTVAISYPYPNTELELGGDSWLNIQADAVDNLSIDRVEFYVDGRLFDTSRSTFNVRWTRENAALEDGQSREIEIWAVAVDAAGNRTESEHVRIRVVGRE